MTKTEKHVITYDVSNENGRRKSTRREEEGQHRRLSHQTPENLKHKENN